jgi:hypothetical protein
MTSMLHNTDAAGLPLQSLAERCHQETLLFLQKLGHDPRFCYELFRRAIVERNEQGWELIYIQYTAATPLLVHWVERHGSFASSGEDAMFFVNRALERLWMTITPERFQSFPDLKSVLRYLQMCVYSAVTDYVRATPPPAVALDEMMSAASIPQSGEELEKQELRAMIDARLNDDKERTALWNRYDLGMKPAEIAERFPDVFTDVMDVYRTLQNIIARLRRDNNLRRFLGDM